MGAWFFQPYHLFNMEPQDGQPDPLELHWFLYNHPAIPDPGTCIIDYKLTGDYPKNVDIDSSGVIKGVMSVFEEQPSCQSFIKPNLSLGFEGKNWDKDGRCDLHKYDFTFMVHVFWKEEEIIHITEVDDEGNEYSIIEKIPCQIDGETVKCTEITELKNYNIDNGIYLNKYLSKYKFGLGQVPGPTIFPNKKYNTF